MVKILVTGHKGFIGSRLIDTLKNCDVVTDSINGKRINLLNIEEVMKIQPVDTVIHLGSKTKKELDWNEYYENNVKGTLNVLEYCVKKNIKKIIFVSSYIYGKPKYYPIDEQHPISPHNLYTKSKFLAEELCRTYSEKYKLNVIILRPFNIFGRTMQKKYLISNLIESINTKEIVTITNRNSKRDFLHIDDFIDIIIKIKDYDFKFEIFNVGSGISYSFNEIIEIIEKTTSKKLNLRYENDEKSFIHDITADISKIKKITKWNPKLSFQEGLEKEL
jgi:nucleoside-diphosphate-sugar epimerase|tara:strand:+ start:488 stop:1315 length:828 start_codon:yes stop_codon:yes gene_type:complete